MPRLVNVRLDLKLPVIGGIQGTSEPDASEVRAAWELYVEMVTRTPLGGFSINEGSTRESLNSIYSLFETTRTILRSYGPSVARPRGERGLSFGYLAVSMLNLVLRPLLTEWHPRLQSWERINPSEPEAHWPDRANFLLALQRTREQLNQYAGLFAEVADVPELLTEGTDATRHIGIRFSSAIITKTTKGTATGSRGCLPRRTTSWTPGPWSWETFRTALRLMK